MRRPPPGRFDVAAFGENSLDTVAVLSAPVPSGGKGSLRSLGRYPGGQAATFAVGCARQGLRARYVGAFGGDEQAGTVRAALVNAGVDVVPIERPGVANRSAVILVGHDGERTVLEYRDPLLEVGASQLPIDDLLEARVLMVDATHLTASVEAARAARARAVPVIADVDAMTADVAMLLELVDVLVVPEAFLRAFTGIQDVGAALRQLVVRFDPAVAVVTMGDEGSLALAEGREIRTPALPTEAVDATGAGDAFRAGFASAWLRIGETTELQHILSHAAATAALNCRAVGAQTALPTFEEVQDLLTAGAGGQSK